MPSTFSNDSHNLSSHQPPSRVSIPPHPPNVVISVEAHTDVFSSYDDELTRAVNAIPSDEDSLFYPDLGAFPNLSAGRLSPNLENDDNALSGSEYQSSFCLSPSEDSFTLTESSFGAPNVQTFHSFSSNIHSALRRLQSTSSIRSDLFIRVPSRGRLDVSIADFCSYIGSTPNALNATVVAIYCYQESIGVRHMFLVMWVMWFRLDRRPQIDSYWSLMTGSFSAPANDTVWGSRTQANVLHGPPNILRNKLVFSKPPALSVLDRLLHVVEEEASQYSVWGQNCYFFCSVVQQYFAAHHSGKFEIGSLRYSTLGSEVRYRIYERLAFDAHGSRRSSVGTLSFKARILRKLRPIPFCVLSGHTDSIASIAFSPNGQRIVSASHDHSVRLWSSNPGSHLLTLEGHSRWVHSVAFSPDGTMVASASADGTVRVWSAYSGTLLYTLRGHTHWVLSIVFSEVDQFIASSSADGTVRVWSTGRGTCLHTLRGHSDWINVVKFSPDGLKIAAASTDKIVRVWSKTSGNLLFALQGHSEPVTSLNFSPDGRWIASASWDRTIRVWSTESGAHQLTLVGHESSVKSVVFSPDGAKIASASSDCTVRVWSTATGTPLLTLEGHSAGVNSVLFSPDGHCIASVPANNSIHMWSADTGVHLFKLKAPSAFIQSVAFSPDGQQIACGADRAVRVWSLVNR